MAELTDQEKRFARELLKNPDDTFRAALVAFNNNPLDALNNHLAWAQRLDIREYQEKMLSKHAADFGMPSREGLARDLYRLAMDDKIAPDTRLKFFRLYAETRGFIEKPGTTVNNNTMNVSNRVMVVKDHGATQSWEDNLKAQQQRLLNGHG